MAEALLHPGLRGRGTPDNPPNRFEPLHLEPDLSLLDEEEQSAPVTQFFRDTSKSLIVRNDSPDVGFEFGINPYRGCEHGCIYCFARPFHDFLGLSSGLDFETRIFVKEDAPELLREELASPKWKPSVLALSGVTDPYQPIERRLQITRRCLEVLRDFRNPVTIITKSHLVTRDVDLLSELAQWNAVSVNVSVTSLDPKLQRLMEPRAAAPHRRLDAIRKLSKAGIPVRTLVAPIIPALNEHEIPAIVSAVKEAGARCAAYVLLRLPHALAPMFTSWLERNFPDRKEKILNRIRSMRCGKLYDSRFFERMRGEGLFAGQIESLFDLSCRRCSLNQEMIELSTEHFSCPGAAQLNLF